MNNFDKENLSNLRLEGIKSELHKREVPREYEQWIDRVNFITMFVPYFMFLAEDYTTVNIAIERLGNFNHDHEITENRLLHAARSEFGKELEKVIRGRELIDLGCGDYNAVRTIAEACSARRYVGVDLHASEKILGGLEKSSDFYSAYIKDDMLSFLSKIDHLQGVVFHLSGLQPVETWHAGTLVHDKNFLDAYMAEENKHYIDASLKEMSRLSQPGDAILAARSAIGFRPERYRFKPYVKSPGDSYTLFIKE